MQFFFFVLAALFSSTSFADISGKYAVKGQLLQPYIQPCDFDFTIATGKISFVASQIKCGSQEFPSIVATIGGDPYTGIGALLKDYNGDLAGAITDDSFSFAFAGFSTHMNLVTPQRGLISISGNGLIFRGELTRK